MNKKALLNLMASSTIILTSLSPVLVSADEIDEGIKVQETRLSELAGRKESAEDLLREIRSDISEAENEAKEVLQESDHVREEIEELNNEIRELESIIASREEKLDEQARTVQSSELNTDLISMVLEADTLSEVIGKVDVVRKIVSANKNMVNKQVDDQKLVEVKREESSSKLNELDVMASNLEELKGQLIKKQDEEQRLVDRIESERAIAKLELDGLLDEKAQKLEDERLEKLRVEKEIKEAEAREQQAMKRAAEEQRVETEAAEESSEASQRINNIVTTSSSARVTSESVREESSDIKVSNVSSSSGDLVGIARKYLGVPYVWGGKSPSGFDCSGFTSYVYREAYGIEIGGWTGVQQYAGKKISVSEARPGDLLFWGSGGRTSHVAIAAGGGTYIHAPKPGDVVKVGHISNFTPSFAVRVVD